MYKILKFLSSFFKTNKVNIDNFVFKLHYKATFALFLAASVLVISKQIFGENISCIATKEYKEIINQFCWINSTFSMKSQFRGEIGRDFAYPGIGGGDWTDQRDYHYHRYYQWVSLVLCVEALCFYFPRHLWKSFENGKISNLSTDLKKPMLDEELIKTQEAHKRQLIKYLSSHMTLHNSYFYKFIFCEFLNSLNVFMQLWFLDVFLDEQFSTYGADVWRFYRNNKKGVDPTDRVFPKVTKCIFYKFGKSGSMERIDTLCVLSLNELNEKIFLILWCWLMLIAFITSFHQFYRALTCTLPKLRFTILRLKFQIVPAEQLEFIFRRCEIGDWWLFYQLAKNIDVVNFKYIMKDLRSALKDFECRNVKIEKKKEIMESGNKNE